VWGINNNNKNKSGKELTDRPLVVRVVVVSQEQKSPARNTHKKRQKKNKNKRKTAMAPEGG
jgi:hypothetical protein